MNNRRNIALALFIVSFAVACGSAEDAPSDVVYTPDTVVAEQRLADQVEAQDGRIAFPWPGNEAVAAKLHVGSIFAGNPSSSGRNPSGFLRRVVSVAREGAMVVLTTEEAQLDELIESGSFSTASDALDFGSGDGASEATLGTKGYARPADIGNYRFHYAAERRVLASFRETKAFKGGQADVAGAVELVGAHFALDPSVSYAFNKAGVNSSVKVDVGGRMSAGIGLKASVAASAQVRIDAGYQKDFGAVSADVYTSPPAKLPTVNLPLGLKLHPQARLKLRLVCERLIAYGAADVEAGVSTHASARFGAELSRAGVNASFTKDFAFQPYWDWNAEAQFAGKCAISAEVRVDATARSTLVDINAGAKVTIDAGIQGDASVRDGKSAEADACGKYSGYVKADANVDGRIKLALLKAINVSKAIPICDLTFKSSGAACAAAPKGQDSCEGRADGTYCSEIAPYFAIDCKGGSVAGGRYCEDVTKQCVRGGTGKATAVGSHAMTCK